MSNTYIPVNMTVKRIAVEDPAKALRTFDLAFVDEDPFTVVARDTDIGRRRLAGSIDGTAHDGHLEMCFDVARFLFNRFGQPNQINLASSTGGAGDNFDTILFKIARC